jgi:hypothetical protein
MLNRIKADFRTEDGTTMLVLGLSMSVTGVLTASGASDVGIGTALGTAVSMCGLFVLVGTVIWNSEQTD